MTKTERHQQLTSRALINTVTALVTAAASFGIAGAPPATADAQCGPGGPPPGAASKDVSDAYGQPATLWITDTIVGIATARGYGEAQIHSPSPLQRSALLIDAQQDGNHQIIVDTGREAILYAVSGCAITPVVDQRGEPFRFDRGHRSGNGDGIGCSDLGDGRRLVGLLQLLDDQHNPLLTVRRTEIDLDGATATIGRSDTVTATSVQDPAWSTAGGISCGDLTMQLDGVEAPH
ncbi:hypothetical protein ACQI5H_13365 [Mycobacterium heidelbergense]|uniref:hypothetical protein n=1 Tax=Mycobacterium heidelbergense TaxID=53376 RepID=UPI003CF01A33